LLVEFVPKPTEFWNKLDLYTLTHPMEKSQKNTIFVLNFIAILEYDIHQSFIYRRDCFKAQGVAGEQGSRENHRFDGTLT
jgi:hypothetical protein